MICDCCRRDVDYVSGSFRPGGARICRECFAQCYNPDDDHVDASDTVSIANYVRLGYGLPPIAATLTIMALSLTSTAYASRHCLDQAEAARTWPTRSLVKDGDGCWTFDRRPTTRRSAPRNARSRGAGRRAPGAPSEADGALAGNESKPDSGRTAGVRSAADSGAEVFRERAPARAVRLARACHRVRDRGRDREARNQAWLRHEPLRGHTNALGIEELTPSRPLARAQPSNPDPIVGKAHYREITPGRRRRCGLSRYGPAGEDRAVRHPRTICCSAPRWLPECDCSRRSF